MEQGEGYTLQCIYYKCAIIISGYTVLTYITVLNFTNRKIKINEWYFIIIVILQISFCLINAKCLISGSIRMWEVDVMTEPPSTWDRLMKQSSLAEQISDYKQRYGYVWDWWVIEVCKIVRRYSVDIFRIWPSNGEKIVLKTPKHYFKNSLIKT